MQRSRFAVATTGALLAASVLGTAAFASGGAVHPSTSFGASTAPLCRSGNLLGIDAGGGAAAGNESMRVGLVNIGSTTCRIGGYPGIIGIRGGHEYRLSHVAHGTFFGNLDASVLTPRLTGALILGTEDGCQAINGPNITSDRQYLAAHSYDGLVLALPGHTGFIRVPGVQFQNACTLSESRLGWANGFSL